MTIPPFSTCVAIDFAHLGEFRLASQTWRKWRPEMWANPMVAFVDTAPPPDGESLGWWQRLLKRTTDHPDLKVVAWPPVTGASQRHRMLSSLLYGVVEHCETEFFLKIDTDTLCLKTETLWHPDWWNETHPYVFVTGAWSYSKGIERWKRLQAWAATVPELSSQPEVPGVLNPAKDHVHHQRIISFFFWGRRSFMEELSRLAPGPLMPIDSQDGFVWYCAKRLGRRFAAVRIKKFGLHHGARGMEKRVAAILKEG